ncbi:hypothetical protein OSB04_023094 [Centaurea solstitialis]|uniref:Uncharacterized protein n=1 Tax=Centaurea solstitialis TaxID=347529 RepID=A0AA38T202_9ASTR|nr:hypothetical protein OSB04_023094 [Centaurea solstitialis]
MNLDRLPTKDNLLKKGVVLYNNLCQICHGCPETVNHIFKKQVRRSINAWWQIFPVDGTDYNGQIASLTNAKFAKEVARYAFLCIIWKKRNEMAFNGTPFIPLLIAHDIQTQDYKSSNLDPTNDLININQSKNYGCKSLLVSSFSPDISSNDFPFDSGTINVHKVPKRLITPNTINAFLTPIPAGYPASAFAGS